MRFHLLAACAALALTIALAETWSWIGSTRFDDGDLAGGDPMRFWGLASLTALIVAVPALAGTMEIRLAPVKGAPVALLVRLITTGSPGPALLTESVGATGTLLATFRT